MFTVQRAKRISISAVAAGLVMAVGCSSQPKLQEPTSHHYSSKADFRINFTASKVVITPTSGYALVQLVPVPRPGVDNRLVWVSRGDQFQIRFEDIRDPAMPPPAPFPEGWKSAIGVPGNWSYAVELDQGVSVPDIRLVKYSIKHITGLPEEDPVLIVRN